MQYVCVYTHAYTYIYLDQHSAEQLNQYNSTSYLRSYFSNIEDERLSPHQEDGILMGRGGLIYI